MREPVVHPLPIDSASANWPRGIAELTLETEDLAAMERFYAGMLGLEVLDRADDHLWLALGERTRLGLWLPGMKEHGDRGGRHVHFAVSAAPSMLDEICRRLAGNGVSVEGPIEHEGGDRSIYADDPAGNRIEIWDFFTRPRNARAGVDALR